MRHYGFRHRARHHRGFYTIAGVGVGGGDDGSPPIPGGSLPNTDYGDDIRVWAQVSASNAEVVANGGKLFLPAFESDGVTPRIYYAGDAGDVRSSSYVNAFNSGLARNGWKTLEGWDGRIQVDLSPTAGGSTLTDNTKGGAFTFGDPSNAFGQATLRLIFSKFDFLNGEVLFRGTDRVRFWDCTGTYPYTVWKSHFDAVCTATGVTVVTSVPNNSTYMGSGSVQENARMKRNSTPTPFRFEQGSGGQYCSRIWMAGCDAHDCGDDAFYFGNTRDIRLDGCRAWKIFNGGSGSGAGVTTAMHNDAFQIVGGNFPMVLLDCMFGYHIQMESNVGNITDVTADRCWQFGSDGVGATIDKMSRTFSNGTGTGFGATFWRWFNNAQVFDPTASPVNVTPPGPSTWNCGFNPLSSPTISISAQFAVPSGVTATGGVLDDVMQAVNHRDNPAVLWKLANTSMDVFWFGTFD